MSADAAATLPDDEPLHPAEAEAAHTDDAAQANAANDDDAADEGRRHPRLELEVAVTLESDDTFYKGLTENISEGGVFVATSCPWPLDTEVDLSLSLGTGTPFDVKTVIRWIREDNGSGITPGMGLEFVDLDDDTQGSIQSFLAERGKHTEFYET